MLLLPRRLRSAQPLGVGAPSASPLAVGLTNLWSAHAPFDVAAKRPVTYIGDPAFARRDGAGLSAGLNGSSRSVNTGAKITHSQGTILLLTDIIATGGDIWSQSTDDAGNGRAISLAGNTFVVNNVAISELTLTTGLHTIVCTWGGSGSHDGYIDDVAQAAYGPSGGTPPAPAGDYGFELGAFRYSGGRLFWSNHAPILWAVWNRILTRGEISAVSRKPWQLFAPQRRWMPVASSSINASTTLTGATSTSAAGTLTATGGASKTLTGASTTSAAGTVTASAGVSATGTLTGAGTTGSAGTLTATGAATGTLTGATTTSSAGTVSASASGNATATLTGATTSTSAGTLTATGNASRTLTGAATTASPGTLTAAGAATATLTGAAITASASGVTASAGGSATAVVTGASTTGSAGILTAAGNASRTLTGASTTASAGIITASNVTHATATLTGASVSATVGALTASGAAQITVTGVQITASAGTINATGGTSQNGVVTLTGAGTTAYAGTLIGASPTDFELQAAAIWNYELESGMTAGNTLTGILVALQQGISVGDLAQAVWTQELPIP